MNRSFHLSFLIAALALGAALCAATANQGDPQAAALVSHPRFHDSPSADPLPPILEPSQFRENRSAFVAYGLAARIPQTIYQIPCYCGCDRHHDHQSLHDCFTGTHGTHCRICQKEAVFCFLQQKKGKSPAEIRQALERGEEMNLNLEKYVRKFYRQLTKANP
jgi:Protein of unknown function with PCYCGC motif